ncbi:MAG: primosomal protein N' [Candidatus Fischerbacteria bacterium RBG_13_37_8]|uniref:Replication restart protein PriA n=1 Tax=Candidatus Fischerbacteria bacterium RBG_13_37_8 TaxID=1817863 RepID=A0A1F5VXC5_9BACT|nr:MAG: primosomal protein N' [Candidatus Fischerbacteria bacterium RBG_13_37_8]
MTYKNTAEHALPEGIRVLVPLRNEQVVGYIVGQEEKANITFPRIKSISEIIDKAPMFPKGLLKLIRWASIYYMRPWGEFMHAALPSGLHVSHKMKVTITQKGTLKTLSLEKLPRPEQAILEFIAERKTVSYGTLRKEFPTTSIFRILQQMHDQHYILIKQELEEASSRSRFKSAIELVRHPEENDKLTKKQQSVIDILIDKGRNTLREELKQDITVSSSVLKALERKGLVRLYEEVVQREVLWPDMLSSEEKIVLTDDQQNAFTTLSALLDKETFNVSLLHGVTGSGKTELYIQLIERTVAAGKSALLLMPEIALVPAMMNRFKMAFGTSIGILHSGLNQAERAEQWIKVKNGDVRIVMGVRSAVFAPLSNIGVIIVDEEHDDSYKQTENPRYHARDSAIMRGKIENALVVLGSATPSLESFHWTQKQIYSYIHLPKRIHEAVMPGINIVDMRTEYKETGDPYFSGVLLREMESCLHKQQQAMILLNRRGYANYLLCRECGQTVECSRCSISLHYHRQYHALVCHYCGLQQAVPEQCPNCHSEFISYIGSGTERIEALLTEKFPAAKIARLDSDIARSHKKLLQLLSDFSYRKIDIMIGTSIIGKGHHFPYVTLVGVISADSALSLPDFRSAEKTFQLITQVAGRAGRGEHEGTVIIQSFLPEHYAIQASQFHDYAQFYNKEIAFRSHLQYPPFISLVNIVVSATRKTQALEAGKALVTMIRSESNGSLKALGPSPSPIFKIANKHRYHILVKLFKREPGKKAIAAALAYFQQTYPRITYTCDVDPISIL